MYKSLIISLSVLCFVIWGCVAGQKTTSIESMPTDAPMHTVLITGDQCEWVPNRITIEKGTHVVLNVRSIDWDYNFRLKDYDLLFKVPKGETVNAEFYASDTGEFEYGCYIEEGQYFYWGGMVGKLIVE
jgi:heme/copper-type cytochrome/quinol oxidase subunit 2